jgi:hypothetical protein
MFRYSGAFASLLIWGLFFVCPSSAQTFGYNSSSLPIVDLGYVRRSFTLKMENIKQI